MPQRDAWLIRRDIGTSTIIIQATHIPSMEVWGMTCKVNGELTDHRQSDTPIPEAIKMVEIAVQNLDAAELGGYNQFKGLQPNLIVVK